MSMAIEETFTIRPQGDTWRVSRPGAAPRILSDPQTLAGVSRLLKELREWAVRPVVKGDAQAAYLEGFLDRLAHKISARITPALLSDTDRRSLVEGLDSQPRRLTIRVEGPGSVADAVLTLPWELISVKPGVFPVKDGRLEVIRDAVVEGAPDLPGKLGPFTVAAAIAAPEDRTALSYEEEAFRLQAALLGLGQRAAFADLGGMEDLVELVERCGAAAIHFSGGGQGGRLLFEDSLGFSEEVAIAELTRRLQAVLLNPGRQGDFPRLFFLSARGVGSGASSATPVLHRTGFRQVVGWFGPEDDDLCSRLEECFYRSLAAGGTVLAAVREARASLAGPVGAARDRRYPLAWTQLTIYHRGPDTPLSAPEEPVPVPHFRRRMVEVNGLPVLEQGFIGRRGLQHEVRRRVHAGQRLLVFQGLGGLGKTALASQLLSHVFAPDTADQVILRCAELDHTSDPIAALRAQVEQHGRDHDFRYWDERALDLRERFPETAPGFGEVVRALRRERPNLVVYADNAENLQTGPVIEDPEMLGAWRAGVEPWWQEMERLAEEGVLVLASTRYAWARLDRRSHLGVGPLSPADCLRMIASFPALRQLPPDVQARLGSRVDGHPRTIELLDRLIAHREGQLGADRKVAEAWSEIIEPVLPEHEEWIRADLLLEKLWERLSEKAREHARHLTVLRRPAPAFVIDRMGTARDELIRSGLLTRFRELSSYQGEARWVERWGVVGLLLRFIPAAKDFPDAHAKAAAAYEEWLLSGGRLRVDQAEVIHHLHAIGMGERAWPTVEDLVLWLRDRGNYREAQDILAGCEAAGTRGGQLASALMLLAQVKRQQGNFGSELDLILKRASALTETEERQHAIRLETSQLWLDRGDLRRAADLLQRLLAETERAQRVPESFRATTMHTLADVLSRQGKYAEAESLLRRAVVIQERDLGTQHPNFAAALDGLAGVLRDRGKYQEAEALFRRARTLHERIWGSEHRTVAASLLGVSSALLWQGRLQESEGALREALRIQETVLGRQHPTWHSALHNLCEVLDRQGKHQEAENLLREVLAAEEEASGEKTLPYAASSYALAKVLTQRGCYEQAEPLLRRALATQGELLGGDHPDYGTTLHGLGDLLDRQGKFAQAEQLFRQAVVIDEGAYGEGHAQHAASVHALAGSVLHQGRHREAEDLLTRCLALQERALGASHPTYAATLQLLASVLEEEGRYAEAEDLLRRVVICDRESLGEDHPSYSFALAALARVLNLRGDLAEAERLIHRALAIQQRSLSRMHPAIAASLNTLAGLLDRQGRTAEAEPLLREALAIQEDSLGKENPNLGPTLANLAGVLMDLGKGQEAEALLHRALQISLAIHGFYRCETGQILSFLAQAQRSMGKPEAAESAFRALRSLHGGPGPEHPITQELTPLLQEIAAGR